LKRSSHLKTAIIIAILWALMFLEMLARLDSGTGIILNVIEEPTNWLGQFLTAIGSIMSHDQALGIAISTGFIISMCFVIRNRLSPSQSKSKQDSV
jgi:hypothetical protein